MSVPTPLLDRVRFYRGLGHQLQPQNESQLESIFSRFAAFCEPGVADTDFSKRCFTLPWSRDWFAPGGKAIWSVRSPSDEDLFFAKVVWLHDLGVPTFFRETANEDKSRPFVYVSLQVNPAQIAELSKYADSKLDRQFPVEFKVDVLNFLLEGMAQALCEQFERDSFLVVALDWSGRSRCHQAWMLSMRLSCPELCCQTRTHLAFRHRMVKSLDSAWATSPPFWAGCLRLDEGWGSAIVEEDVYSPLYPHPLVFCDWMGPEVEERRPILPFAISHVRIVKDVESSRCDIASMHDFFDELKGSYRYRWIRLGSTWGCSETELSNGQLSPKAPAQDPQPAPSTQPRQSMPPGRAVVNGHARNGCVQPKERWAEKLSKSGFLYYYSLDNPGRPPQWEMPQNADIAPVEV
mmetsp:Transcript_66197/g.147142  ORF Transcript_66197/g.147142 Transcript_66197/m.147142 type:complete len:406 (+) Transcript_66197:53-1270(+)